MSEKKNISILTIDYGAGGAERVISLLLKEMVKDFNLTLVIYYNYVDYDIPEGVELVILLPNGDRTNTLYRKTKDTLLIAKKYNKLIKDKKIDVSISFLALPNIINGIVNKRNSNLKTIISERCFPSIMYKANRSSDFLSKYVFPIYYAKNDHLFSNSEYINIDLKQNFKVNMSMSVIYNPIEIDDLHIKPLDSIKESETLNIINVGSIYEPKNQK
ncbi:MAG: glycosyltransferase, partial [Bacteroidota bacterium]